jgi:hypothetical protein
MSLLEAWYLKDKSRAPMMLAAWATSTHGAMMRLP